MQPFSPHNRFFSSLNQLQQRLSSEDQNQNQPSLSSPLYLTNPKPHPTPTTTTTSSGPPLDFLSNSPITNDQQQQHKEQEQEEDDDDVDDIETLMGLLGLSIPLRESGKDESCSCDCSGAGFYSKIAGVKGPRCEKEKQRLDGWIELLYSEERREPARLAHLLIGKAVAFSRGGGDGFEGVEFPGTVEEFLEHDPLPKIEGE